MNRIQNLLSLAKTEWKVLSLGFFFRLISGGLGLYYPKAAQLLIDEAILSENVSRLNEIALLLFGVILVQGFSATARYWLFTLAGERIVLHLRMKLFRHLLDQEITFFDRTKTGELMSRLSSDCAVIQNAVSVNISMLLRNILQAVGGMILLFMTSVRMTSVALVLIPPIAVGVYLVGKRIRKLSRESQDALALTSHAAEEAFGGIRLVRSFVQEERERARDEGYLLQLLKLIRQRVKAVSVFMVVVSTLAGAHWRVCTGGAGA